MRSSVFDPRLVALAFAAAASVLVSGCQGEEADTEPAVIPKAVVFTGQTDARFVGAWATANGASKLDLAKDGALRISTATPSPKGLSKSTYVGSWLVEGKSLRLRYRDKADETTIEYGAALQGDKLVLQQPGGRLKTTYLRK